MNQLNFILWPFRPVKLNHFLALTFIDSELVTIDNIKFDQTYSMELMHPLMNIIWKMYITGNYNFWRIANSSNYTSSSPEIIEFIDVSLHCYTSVTFISVCNNVKLNGRILISIENSYQNLIWNDVSFFFVKLGLLFHN